MQNKPLVWTLFPIYFIITLVSVMLVGFLAVLSLRSFYYSEATNDQIVRTRLIQRDLPTDLTSADTKSLNRQLQSLDKSSEMRITIISPSGEVVADSEYDSQKMEDHGDRPEFIEAMQGKVGKSRRPSPTLDINMIYVAIPVRHNGQVNAVLRTSMAASALDAPPAGMVNRIALAMLMITILAGLVSWLAARRISGPLLKMKTAAGRFAEGDFSSRVPIPDTAEFASLANTLNRMAAQLEQQVRRITEQSSEREAILSSMKEGVVAIDNDDRILIMNPMAEMLLGTKMEFVNCKTIQEAVRNPDLQRFFGKTHENQAPNSEEIVIRADKDMVMQAAGTALLDADHRRIGALVVLNDITHTRKLENLRKDFVANVSHELKTPITSIKGFVETLREGAVRDPDKAREFLAIVARQVDRLNAIIDDLLALSRIEQETQAETIPLQRTELRSVLTSAVRNCDNRASQCNVNLKIECEDALTALINPPLLEQAVTNLIDNACKYSPDGNVSVKAARENNEVAIHVEDTGPGIEPEHLPRLFERFYRVDKARSRKLGGTGLGLAIVKHIVQAHNGRVDVQSTLGKGSTFSIYLPGE